MDANGDAAKKGNGLNGASKVIAVLGGVVVLFMFLQNFAKTDRLQIEHNVDAIQRLSLKVDKGEADHANGLAKAAAMAEKFIEVETQFKNLDERTLRIETRFGRELLAMDDRLQKEFQKELDRLSDLEELVPRIAIAESYLMWLKRKIEVIPPEIIQTQ